MLACMRDVLGLRARLKRLLKNGLAAQEIDLRS
jgi:hypothetical protein